jgi:hypothetical protein
LDYELTLTPGEAVALGRVLNGSGDALGVLKDLPIPNWAAIALQALAAAGKLTGQGNSLIADAKKAQRLAAQAGNNRNNQPRKVGEVILDIGTFKVPWVGWDTGVPTTNFTSDATTKMNT